MSTDQPYIEGLGPAAPGAALKHPRLRPASSDGMAPPRRGCWCSERSLALSLPVWSGPSWGLNEDWLAQPNRSGDSEPKASSPAEDMDRKPERVGLRPRVVAVDDVESFAD